MVAWLGGCSINFCHSQPLDHAVHLLTAFSPSPKHPSSNPAKAFQPCLDWSNLARRMESSTLSRSRARSPTIHPIHFSGCGAEVCREPICSPVILVRCTYGASLVNYIFCGMHVFREAPFSLSPPLFGHCPNSNYTPHTPAPPRPHANGHSGALFSGAIFPF